MKAKILFALAALLMLGSVSLNAQENGNSSNSESTTQLEGDLNHDGKVDVADVTYLVNLIMKNKSEAKDGVYYWYIGAENPSVISDIQSDNTVAGWHEIGESLNGFELVTTNNPVVLSTTERVRYYVVIPNELSIFDDDYADGSYLFEEITCNISGYKAYLSYYEKGVWDVQGIIIKEGTSNESINDNYYWYIGVENPASISDIQTDNTKPGWHSIGTSLSDFVLDTNTNRITLSTTDRVIYYVVIPNELYIYNGLNINIESIDFVEETCNITGYKAFRFVPEEGVSGVKHVSGPIIKEGIPVSEVSISTSESSINVGNTLQLEATVEPSNATNQNVTWSSSNPEIATVDEATGLVTGVAIGTATITATSVDGGKTATATVNVVETLSNYYWYIGVENPSSISNIQTDNTKPGWHSIGTTLSGFNLDTDENPVILSTTLTDKYMYYVVIPNELNLYDADGASILYSFNQVECSITGYKAYHYDTEVRRARGVYIH